MHQINMLTAQEFRGALEKGLGRAWIHVNQKQLCNEHLDIFIESCLSSWVYDHQVEGGRSDWLFSMIPLTKKEQYIEELILRKLSRYTDESGPSDTWCIDQILDLTTEFACEGSKKARLALYAWFENSTHSETWLGGLQIIDLDGLDGFLRIAERVGKRLRTDKDFWEDDFILEEVKDRLGEQKVLNALTEAAELSENIAEYKNLVHTKKSKNTINETSTERFSEQLTFDQVLDEIENCVTESPFKYWQFGKKASDDEVAEIWNRFLLEERTPQLIRLLWFFGRRAIPQVPEKIINLAQSDCEELSSASIEALQLVSSPRVRELALNLLSATSYVKAAGGLELLKRHFQPGDEKTLKDFIARIPGDIDDVDVHSYVSDILDLIKGIDTSNNMKTVLTWCYENSPCMVCRKDAVKWFIDHQTLPVHYLEECKLDGNMEIRNLLKNMSI